MPFLKPALQLHLERFPFVRNGLGRIQNRGWNSSTADYKNSSTCFLDSVKPNLSMV